MKRRALGKGLGSLLPERPPLPAVEGFVKVDISRIVPNPHQPRESFDEAELEDLAASIRRAGILQPILLRHAGTGYEIIAGERRWRAARLAGLTQVPAVIQKVEEVGSLELALIENIQRAQLNPIEEARAFSALMDDFHLTQEAIAERVGRKRSTIANSLRLLRLPADVQDLIRSGKLTAGHAKTLLALADDEEIRVAAKALVAGYVTVRGAEEMAKSRQPGATPREAERSDPNIRDAEQRLQRALGTKVRIRAQASGKGRIEVEFYSLEELERLFDILEGNAKGH
ncbi:MAG TPA: ParB/RepB/Spo0J family partition protein [Candidatus Polarisedimenticolia bacterium]|nr:ParB/RepB/Spo0J family partition protein [Candidatus Polarisedimenticolia bacterium]